MGRRYYDYDDEDFDDDDDDFEDNRPRRKRRKKRGSTLGHIYRFLVVLAILFLTFIGYLYLTGRVAVNGGTVEDAKKTVVKKAVTTMIEREIKSQTGENVDLEAVKEQMEPEDQEKVDELLDKYSDEDVVKDVISAYKDSDGDLMEVKDSISGMVDEEDMEEMRRLYEKYADSFDGGR